MSRLVINMNQGYQMNPKSIITVTAQNLPMVLKYQGKEYVIKSTAKGGLHMIKDNFELPERPEPPPPPPDPPPDPPPNRIIIEGQKPQCKYGNE